MHFFVGEGGHNSAYYSQFGKENTRRSHTLVPAECGPKSDITLRCYGILSLCNLKRAEGFHGDSWLLPDWPSFNCSLLLDAMEQEARTGLGLHRLTVGGVVGPRCQALCQKQRGIS